MYKNHLDIIFEATCNGFLLCLNSYNYYTNTSQSFKILISTAIERIKE